MGAAQPFPVVVRERSFSRGCPKDAAMRQTGSTQGSHLTRRCFAGPPFAHCPSVQAEDIPKAQGLGMPGVTPQARGCCWGSFSVSSSGQQQLLFPNLMRGRFHLHIQTEGGTMWPRQAVVAARHRVARTCPWAALGGGGWGGWGVSPPPLVHDASKQMGTCGASSFVPSNPLQNESRGT